MLNMVFCFRHLLGNDVKSLISLQIINAMSKIKFGTDGWRAIIAEDFTVNNVLRVSEAVSKYVLNQPVKRIVIGHDCRFAGELFMQNAIRVFVKHGIEVLYAEGFVSTPMVSLACAKYNAAIGVVLTASHNPPSYNGYKLKAFYGGPLGPEEIQVVEDMILDSPADYSAMTWDEVKANSLVTKVDLEKDYIDAIRANFDLDAINNSGLKLAFDAMYGSGQRVIRQVLNNVSEFHCEPNPSFMGQAPEPIEKNLQEVSNFLKNNPGYAAALAIDGDADRIGLFNGKGEFIDSHHIILLLINYLHKYKGLGGRVVTAFSCTPKVEKMCKIFGLEHETVKIGFKYIAGKMVDGDVLLGGEESGGIAIKSHIPERDGIWMGLVIFEYMAKSGKSLDELIDEVYALVGGFKFERNDLHITENLKQEIIAKCEAKAYAQFGEYNIIRVETIDGFKFFFDDDRWVMIRPSGTEPVLRVYAEAPTMDEVRNILKQTSDTICNN
jgi:phosphomannomutase